MKRTMLSAAVLGLLGFGASFSALAVNYPVNLCAGVFEKDLTPEDGSMTDGNTVTMWGYSRGSVPISGDGSRTESDGCGEGAVFTSPGPRISIPRNPASRSPWDGLEIRLKNTLSRTTSLVIPGTVKPMTPQFFTPDGESLPRVKSFDLEAQPGGSQTYVWKDLAPGSYLYHSGTHPQVQVQMGLYGAATMNHSDGSFDRFGNYTDSIAYLGATRNGSVSYSHDADIVLFYTEIDRVIHDNVTDNTDATPNYDEIDMQSTIGYAPKYFAVDVDPGGSIAYDPTTGVIDIPNGVTPLIRFLNAGYRTHVPTVYSGGFDIRAEDGKLYPNARKQYSVHLPPLKTKDAILDLGAGTGGGTFALTDSAMALSSPEYTNSGVAIATASADEIANGDSNGMGLTVSVRSASGSSATSAPSAEAPVARDDRMTVTEGDMINSVLASALSNDTNASLAAASILSYPKQGELVSDGNTYRYEHAGGEENRDSFIYEVTNAAGERSLAGVVIDVMPVNDAPVASDDTVSATVGELIEIRALRNDSDVDSTIRITAVDSSGLGSLTANDQVIVFEATTVGAEDVTYTIADTAGATASAVLHLSVAEATEVASVYSSSAAAASGGSGSSGGVAPNATADGYSVNQGQVIDTSGKPILGVLANDSTGVVVNTKLVEYPANGSIQINEDGTFVYTHDGSAVATDDFVYEIFNGNGTARAKVTITVNLGQ